jgi:hypothetical protein
VNLAEKIQVKVYANQDKSLADLKILSTLMISIVFCSLIIHEFDKYFYCFSSRSFTKLLMHVYFLTANFIRAIYFGTHLPFFLPSANL